MLAIGMGKKPPKGEEKEEVESEEGGEDEFAEFSDAAFEALKNDDRDAFREAFRGAVESCMEY